METDEAHEAVVHLVAKSGVYCASDDLSVKKVTTSAGHTLYVVLALNGIAHAVKDALAPLIAPRLPHVDGVWVLRANEVSELVRQSDQQPL